MARIKEFDKYRTLGPYHWKYLRRHPDYIERVEAVCAKVAAGQNCLDLGCGDGAYIYRVAAKCNHVVGVDVDPDGLRWARRQLDKHQVKNYTLIEANFADLLGRRRLHPAIRRYELIYSMDCIEHLYEPAELLELMSRHLGRHGLAIVGTPLFISADKVSPYHVKEYTQPELEGLLSPYFTKVEGRLLEARAPDTTATTERFYVYYGRPRRRWWNLWS